MDQATPTPTPSSGFHLAIISLLFLLLIGTLVAVGLLVMRSEPETVAVSAEACQGYVTAAEAEAETACNELRQQDTRSAVGTVPAHEGTIGFQYPLGWSVSTETFPTQRVTWRANLVPGYIALCNECDGPFIDISMQVGSKTDAAIVAQPDFHAYLLTIYTASNGFSDITIDQVSDGSGRRYTVTGQLDGMYQGPITTIYYEGRTDWASVFFMDKDAEDNTSNEGWEIVKSSLDFSGIN